MKEKKKVGLEAIEVQSFITTLDKKEQELVNGGSWKNHGTTDVPLFC